LAKEAYQGKRAVNRRILLLFFILILSAASYSNVIQGEFQFDDDLGILKNPLVVQPSELFTAQNIKSFFEQRPLTILTFAINYALGERAVEGYHTVNIIIHLLTVIAVFFFVRMTLLRPLLKDAFKDRAEWMALIAAGIFALHPLQTETVSYIMQRAEALSSLFYLLALSCLTKFSDSEKGRSLSFWVSGIIFFFLGFSAKQTMVTLPVIYMLYLVFFAEQKGWKKGLLGILPLILTGIPFVIIAFAGSQGSAHAGFHMAELGQPEYFYTEMRALFTYLRMIYMPVGLNVDHDYPIYRELLDPTVLFSSCFWLVAVGLSFLTLRVKGEWRYHLRVVGFGMIWFFVLLLPSSSLVPLRDVFAEHRVYLAMMGPVLCTITLTDLVLRIIQRAHGKQMYRVVSVGTTMILVLLFFSTYERNRVWQTSISLWQDAVTKSPRKARPNYNLGTSYFKQRNFPGALYYYLIAKNLDPEYPQVYYNLCLTYGQLGYMSDANAYCTQYGEMKRNQDTRRLQP
jgi:tetratricopeptide (TPR) repeat protein